ncbi:MAG: hypothetical protein LAO55_27565 [Acidobacteriia bacterium]|nr:hypothetical protein [Terriglobia bacterium]
MSGRRFSGTLAAKFNPFEEDYLCEILEATAHAWSRMKHPDANEIEDRITFRVAGRLANDPKFAELPYDVAAQHWLVGLDGQRLGRLDLRFQHRQSKRDYFAFEAKRLHVTYPSGRSTEYPTYVGADGMMAFVAGQYSTGLSAGGMLGYVMDDKVDKAWTGLEARIDSQRTPLKLVGRSKFVRSVLSNAIAKGMEGTLLGETKHGLRTHELRLFHLLLPVRYGYAGRGSGRGRRRRR